MLHYSRILAAAVALLAIGTSAAPAQNQTALPCFNRGVIVPFLADHYGEALTAAGISSAGLLLEVYVSETGRTWTITATLPTGQVCMLANGFEWRVATKHESETNPQ